MPCCFYNSAFPFLPLSSPWLTGILLQGQVFSTLLLINSITSLQQHILMNNLFCFNDYNPILKLFTFLQKLSQFMMIWVSICDSCVPWISFHHLQKTFLYYYENVSGLSCPFHGPVLDSESRVKNEHHYCCVFVFLLCRVRWEVKPHSLNLFMTLYVYTSQSVSINITKPRIHVNAFTYGQIPGVHSIFHSFLILKNNFHFCKPGSQTHNK